MFRCEMGTAPSAARPRLLLNTAGPRLFSLADQPMICFRVVATCSCMADGLDNELTCT